MADILISGMDMLPEGFAYDVRIKGNGDVVDRLTGVVMGKAIELPPHENLTEQSAFWNMLHEICVKCNHSGDIDRYQNRCIWCKIKEAYEKVYQTPTILEASKERE